MTSWEKMRPALIVGGVFLALAFLIWLFALRGFEARRAAAERTLKNLDERRAELFQGERPIATARREATQANDKLTAAIADETARRLYVFTKPPDPDPGVTPSLFLTNELHRTEMEFRARIVRARNINVVESAIPMLSREANQSLGFVLSSEASRVNPADVRLIIRQLEVLNRFRDLLAAAHDAMAARDAAAGEAAAETHHFDSLLDLKTQALPAVDTGTAQEKFLREYRLWAKLRCTWPGLLELLAQCGTAEHFHAVRTLDLRWAREGGQDSTRRSIQARRVLPAEVNAETGARTVRERRRYLNFYDVTIELATLTAIAPAEVKTVVPAGENASGGPPRGRAILH